jgi:hypothetical protein
MHSTKDFENRHSTVVAIEKSAIDPALDLMLFELGRAIGRWLNNVHERPRDRASVAATVPSVQRAVAD